MSIRTSLIALTFLLIPAIAHAESGRVIGDSIGVGVYWGAKGASNVVSTAKLSVSIYSGAIMEQLRQAKEGETVFLSLGTNDAVGGALDVKAKVAAILAEANKLGVKLVWIGPPCVLKPWEKYSKELDGILAAELEGKAKYVSTQTEEFCSPNLHAGEGVHFTMAGYTRMWQKAAAAAGFSSAVAVASAEPAQGGPGPSHKHAKRHKHKSHAKRHSETTEKPDTSEAAPK
jgi:hypothetical protein